jgi:hypothetical protein
MLWCAPAVAIRIRENGGILSNAEEPKDTNADGRQTNTPSPTERIGTPSLEHTRFSLGREFADENLR